MWRNRKSRPPKDLDAKKLAALVDASQISEQEIRRWHTDFLDRYPSGLLDKKAFVEYSQKLHPDIGPEGSFEKIFEMIDANNDGTIDFNELLVVIVLMSRLNALDSRLAFAFDMYDASGDERIDREELADVISAIYDHAGITDRKGERDPKKRAKEIISQLDDSGDNKLNKEEFIKGCKNDPVIRGLLTPSI
ncbi:unnamed protein product [Adineta steineri]|uniref:EF-hand domain-containing protein n=1 Tax=Adineta steineri TaxID=433720 RepID=A0A818XXW3_9BILA|nr:unnamed protein product [Adineta steineri]CAF3745242.1 unnamed protein product [Adineta steineri]CAF3811286.1 unnamed protein product [Adineta steineri]